MAKVINNFLKGKMNKDLDERLVPKGVYKKEGGYYSFRNPSVSIKEL